MDAARLGVEEFEKQAVAKIAVMYAVAYLYEHREEADHHALVLGIRSLLFGVRQVWNSDGYCTYERKGDVPEECCGDGSDWESSECLGRLLRLLCNNHRRGSKGKGDCSDCAEDATMNVTTWHCTKAAGLSITHRLVFRGNV